MADPNPMTIDAPAPPLTTANATATSNPSFPPPPPSSGPPAIICIGMAGSGKTTFMQRINAYLHGQRKPPYIINLDPAVKNIPFERNIDIRDSVDYREVMKQYNLGPNGGIMTSLNLFSTKIDQVINILEQRAPNLTNILVDTPGQIECFVWSASGAIITDSLASTFPTVIAYIIDTPRTANTATFMANMLYACSILYKTKLPMILVFNKVDVTPCDFAHEWMTDFETFQEALRRDEGTNPTEGYGGSGYMGNLLNSMSLVLEEFYKHLNFVGVSAMTGEGVEEFFEAVKEKVEEYEKEYKPELEASRKRRADAKVKQQQKELDRLMKDMNVSTEGEAGGRAKKRKGGECGGEDEERAGGIQADVLSDIETDEEELVEPDEGPNDDEGPDAELDTEAGLEARYRNALYRDGRQKESRDEEESLRRYLARNA